MTNPPCAPRASTDVLVRVLAAVAALRPAGVDTTPSRTDSDEGRAVERAILGASLPATVVADLLDWVALAPATHPTGARRWSGTHAELLRGTIINLSPDEQIVRLLGRDVNRYLPAAATWRVCGAPRRRLDPVLSGSVAQVAPRLPRSMARGGARRGGGTVGGGA